MAAAIMMMSAGAGARARALARSGRRPGVTCKVTTVSLAGGTCVVSARTRRPGPSSPPGPRAGRRPGPPAAVTVSVSAGPGGTQAAG